MRVLTASRPLVHTQNDVVTTYATIVEVITVPDALVN
jgi:hypothetical protein